MMESSRYSQPVPDVSDKTEDIEILSVPSPPLLGVRTLLRDKSPSQVEKSRSVRSNSDVCLEDIESKSGEIFLRDEILASRSPWRLVEKENSPEVKEPPLRSSGFSSEFAKFLKNNTDGETKPVKDFVTRKCSVRLVHLDIDVNSIPEMETKSVSPCIEVVGTREPMKRDNDSPVGDGPQNKKPKSDDVIILESDTSNKSSPDISIVKLTKNPTKENKNGSCEKKNEPKTPENRIKTDKLGQLKPISIETGKKPDLPVPKSSKSLPINSLDKTDRTSLQCLEQKLLDLKKSAKDQQKTKSHDNHQKFKSMSPSGTKTSKDNHHRRNDTFVLERKKTISSPVKKIHKKPYSAPATPKENKLGGLFCPTTDAKVTILPCKTVPKEETKPLAAGSNSVTITKVSSGDTLSVTPKDIKKVFSPKSENKLKLSPSSTLKPEKTSPKPFMKSDKFKTGDKFQKEHRHKDKEYKSRESSKERREKGERRERVGSLKIIRCSKCREVFSTKEAKKLHTCNSILDARYLIDGGDRQKTSPVSSTSSSDRSESTSASLSRSSSRSSSPGMTVSSVKKSGDGSKLKPRKLEEDKVKVKISLAKVKQDEDERKKYEKGVKKDPMREKWVENKLGGKLDRGDLDLEENMKHRHQGLVIEAIHSSDGHQSSSMEMMKKDDHFSGDGLFSFSGKRTYSPSMSESTQNDGKGSPRETNSKDSPASQADSGVFSIASSASPSKLDGGINSDVRSPDSPRTIESLKSEHSQWKLGMGVSMSSSSGDPKHLSTMKNPGYPRKTDGPGNGFPQGISLPLNTSITRVLPQPNSSSYSTNMNPNKSMGMSTSTWMTSQQMSSYYLDENSKKKRGRPRKNGDPIFSGKFKNPKPKMSDDDKDMYDFEMEEDETKPMQPLRPRRQNAQPVTYKDPDSDEDAKGRQPQVPLIQATLGYKDIHEKALGLQTDNYDGDFNSSDNVLDDQGEMDGEDDEKDRDGEDEKERDGEEDEKEKNISWCSMIEETPKGGIKLKLKIKKPVSPAAQDPEPPLKKTKLDSSDDSDEYQKPEPSMINEVQRMATALEPKSEPETKVNPKPVITQEIPVISSVQVSSKPTSMMTPGLAGGMQPKVSTPPQTSQGVAPPVRSYGSNNNPLGIPPVSTGQEDGLKGPSPPKVQNPYAIQKQNYPPAGNPNQTSYEMQQNYPTTSNYADFPNYNPSYSSYMEQQQQQQQQQQQHSQMYSSNQYQQHMASFRPGVRPGSPMMQRPQQAGFMGGRIMDPRFPHMQNPISDVEAMHGGMNTHMGGMPMGMGSHMGPGMSCHPAMMGGMMPGLSSSSIPMGSYPSSPMNVLTSMNQNPMSVSMGPAGIHKGPMMNSPVMSPISGHGGMIPRSMSPQSLGERTLVGPPSMSPQSIPGSERSIFPPGQYRLSSPQYSPAHQGPVQPSYSHSPTYSGAQGYPQPNLSHMYKPPTPQTYPKPPTPQSYHQPSTPQGYPKPPTPQSYPKPPTPQNPNTPGSYPNPSTPGAYQNPTTPLSQQNPLTPQSYDPPTPQASQHNNSFESSITQPVIQQNPLVSAISTPATSSFILPKTESVIQSPVHNVFKDSSKITTPMLSPPSTTSSLRKIRRPSKSVTPGTVSPNQKTLSPNQSQVTVKMENDSVIVPKLEPLQNSPPISVKSEPVPFIKKEPDMSPKPDVKRELVLEEEPKPSSPPPRTRTPDPPKEEKWGEDGEFGMPEKALELIFSFVCHTEGCLPFLPSAMRVCKLWNKVAMNPALWTHANLGTAVKEKSRTEKKLEWILKNKFPNAIHVDVTSWKAVMSTPALKIIASNCPKITGLGMSNCVKLNFEDIRIVPSLFPLLERIDLSLVSPSTASSRSAVSSSALSDLITALGDKLTHFNMSSNKMAGLPFVFKALSQHSKNLKFLDVSNISTTSRDTILINIEKLQKGCPKLRTFRTTNTMLGLNEVPVREQVAAPGFPYLEELTIGVDQRGYFDGMDDGQIERILKKSNKLKLLDIRGCKGISDSTLVRLPCWDIEYMYVAGCSVTSSSRDGLELLVKKWCATLIELDIGLTPDARTVDWAVMALVENEDILKLRKLNLNGTGVNLKPLTKLLNCCKTLESLNLSACRALPRGMKRMYHSRDDIESLRKDIEEGKFNARDTGSDGDD